MIVKAIGNKSFRKVHQLESLRLVLSDFFMQNENINVEKETYPTPNLQYWCCWQRTQNAKYSH